MKKCLSVLVLGGVLVAPSVCWANNPDPEPSDGPPSPVHMSLWGFDLCVGGTPMGVTCDFTLKPTQASSHEPHAARAVTGPPRRFSLLGRDVCFGAHTSGCWMSFPLSANDNPSAQMEDGRGS